MKNLILIISVTMFTLTYSYAQSESRLGVKGGVNFAKWGGDFSDDFQNRTDFHVGVLTELSLFSRLSIQAELLYSEQGNRVDDRPRDGSLKETRLNYILLPVMPKFYFSNSFSILAGPQLGYLITANQEVTGSGFITGDTTTREFDIKEELNNLEIGLTIGAEYRFDFGAFIQLRYNFGLTNINELEQNPSSTIVLDTENFNNVYQASVGFSF